MEEVEMLTEVWKVIEGCPGYEVSSLGRVKSLVKAYRRKEKILKGTANSTGYTLVQLYPEPCNRKSLLVHRLVMMTFQPNPVMDQLHVNHKDLNPRNNALSNLEWMTEKENSEHYWKNPNIGDRLPTPSGATHHLAVMTDELVIEFRRRWEEVKDVYGQRSKLAREFGIAESTARLITDGKTWKHLLPME